ncbi:hypothetical protein L2X99_16060 [Microbacterium sp. KUDC0406]|uniref:hypothetical protein n=1 Tax=Microbacterium sp. KUDC0406 TaxID=2909588 RepID=UPI001F42916D|nr:hypothetical protein [Microbacterium sp. KUDC0406]UJP09869.1 hypothetical protein L2X99_16060 [Microbacterium sp. KUDC0406]
MSHSLPEAKELLFFRHHLHERALDRVGDWIHATIIPREILMDRDDSTELFDLDAHQHFGRPYWFDKHPSQAEGEDF